MKEAVQGGLVFLCLFLAVMADQKQWDDYQMDQQQTVAQRADIKSIHVIGAVIEDAQALRDEMKERSGRMADQVEKCVGDGLLDSASVFEGLERKYELMHWRACRVVAFLEKLREGAA